MSEDKKGPTLVKKEKKKLLTKMQLLYVAAHQGNDAEAALAAGYSNPSQAACNLMTYPHVREAIEAKQKKIVEAAGTMMGKAMGKTDVIERLSALANLDPLITKGTIQGQVNALRTIAEIQGYIIRKTEDVTEACKGKSEAEMEFFTSHGYWPNMESGKPGSTGSESPGPNPPKSDKKPN